MDECREDSSLCSQGECLNVPGSFICKCKPGFVMSTDGRFCTGKLFKKIVYCLSLFDATAALFFQFKRHERMWK